MIRKLPLLFGLLTGAAIAGPLFTAAFSWLMLKRIEIEERALTDAQCG